MGNAHLARSVLKGIQNGFDPHIDTTQGSVTSATRNHPTSPKAKLHIIKDLLRGLDLGFLLGPISVHDPRAQSIIWSPVGTVPKDIDKLRLIHDLSHRASGTSVNDLIDSKYTYVSYIQTREVVQFIDSLGPGALFWIADMQDAYRRVPIIPRQRRFLGIQWENMFVISACLPFGLSASCQIYSTFAEGIRQIAINTNPGLFLFHQRQMLFNYLDDFFGQHPDLKIAAQQFQAFLALIAELGIPTQDRKCHKPATQQIILGFLYSSVTRIISIPQRKIKIILRRLDRLIQLSTGKVSRREIATVVGVLMWAAQVIFPAKAMLRRLQYFVDKTKWGWDQRQIQLNNSVRCDLVWWKTIIQSSHNGISFDYILKTPKDADIHIWTDAAGTDFRGCGGYSTLLDFYQIRWDKIPLSNKSRQLLQEDIVYKEFLALVVTVLLWGHKFTNKAVTFHCDNKSVVGIVTAKNCDYARHDLMDLMRVLAETAFKHRFWFWIDHVPGKQNIEADRLSRWQSQPFQRLYSQPARTTPELSPFFAKQPSFSESSVLCEWDAYSSVNMLISLLSVFRYKLN